MLTRRTNDKTIDKKKNIYKVVYQELSLKSMTEPLREPKTIFIRAVEVKNIPQIIKSYYQTDAKIILARPVGCCGLDGVVVIEVAGL